MRNDITREKQQMLFDLHKFSGVEKELGHPREQENSRILGCKSNSIILEQKLSLTLPALFCSSADVRIIDPATAAIVVNRGVTFTLECEGGEGAHLMWRHNGVVLTVRGTSDFLIF